MKEPYGDSQTCSGGSSPHSSLGSGSSGVDLDTDEKKSIMNQGLEIYSSTEGNMVNSEIPTRENEDISEKAHTGVHWDVFRQQDVPKLTEYLKMHQKELGKHIDKGNELMNMQVSILILISFLIFSFGLFATFDSGYCNLPLICISDGALLIEGCKASLRWSYFS